MSFNVPPAAGGVPQTPSIQRRDSHVTSGRVGLYSAAGPVPIGAPGRRPRCQGTSSGGAARGGQLYSAAGPVPKGAPGQQPRCQGTSSGDRRNERTDIYSMTIHRTHLVGSPPTLCTFHLHTLKGHTYAPLKLNTLHRPSSIAHSIAPLYTLHFQRFAPVTPANTSGSGEKFASKSRRTLELLPACWCHRRVHQTRPARLGLSCKRCRTRNLLARLRGPPAQNRPFLRKRQRSVEPCKELLVLP